MSEVGAVFSIPQVGSLKYVKCPACGRRSVMDVGVQEQETWPPEPPQGRLSGEDEGAKREGSGLCRS